MATRRGCVARGLYYRCGTFVEHDDAVACRGRFLSLTRPGYERALAAGVFGLGSCTVPFGDARATPC
jgi:hypothetical protein